MDTYALRRLFHLYIFALMIVSFSVCQDFVKALEDEAKKEQRNNTLRTVDGQSLQADPTPTYFNDPFMDNGGFFAVCKEGCTHGEAHKACVNAGAELASIHRFLFSTR